MLTSNYSFMVWYDGGNSVSKEWILWEKHANIKCLTLMVWYDGGNSVSKEWILWESMPTSRCLFTHGLWAAFPLRGMPLYIKCVQCHDIIPAINPPWRIPWGSHDWYLCTCLSLNLSLLIKQGNINMYLPVATPSTMYNTQWWWHRIRTSVTSYLDNPDRVHEYLMGNSIGAWHPVF